MREISMKAVRLVLVEFDAELPNLEKLLKIPRRKPRIGSHVLLPAEGVH